MDPYPDQEVTKASEPGSDRTSPNGRPGQYSSRRESIAVDSANPNLVRNERRSRGLDEECDDEVRHPEGAQGRDHGVVSGGVVGQESGDRPIPVPESPVLDDADESVVELNKFPEPYFLRRVLLTEWEEIDGDNYLLLAVTVHSIMLESGFLRIDPVTRSPLRHARVSSSWPKEPSTAFSLHYSLPGILARDNNKSQGVALKLQILGRFLIVYGSLTSAKSELRRMCLYANSLGQKIRLMMNFYNENSVTGASSTPATCRFPEKLVFELWRRLKEGLVLPLLIDLSVKAGSRAPSSFSTLPGDRKLEILEYLKGVDIARAGCVCSELRQLSSNEDLWKKTYRGEFGDLPQHHAPVRDWKKMFAWSWRWARGRSRREDPNQPAPVLYPGYHTYFPIAFPVAIPPPQQPPWLGHPQPRIHRPGRVNPRFARNYR